MVNFASPVRIKGTDVRDAEEPRIAARGDNVYVAWREVPPPPDTQHEVWLARSVDQGKSFEQRTNVSNTRDQKSESPVLALGDDHVFVAWIDTDAAGLTVARLRRSGDEAQSFGSLKTLSTTTNPVLLSLDVAVDGSDVYVSWLAPGPLTIADVFVAHSEDDGHSFKPEVNVSNNGQGANTLQDAADPRIATSDDRVIVAWRNFAPDPAPVPDPGVEVYAARGR